MRAMCGSMIFTGKYCEDCNNKIKTTVNEINNSMNKDKEEKKIRVMSINRAKLKESKMRFMKSDK